VAPKMTNTSVGPNRHFRRHNRRIQFDMMDMMSICMSNRYDINDKLQHNRSIQNFVSDIEITK